jgi:hypothetical protein
MWPPFLFVLLAPKAPHQHIQGPKPFSFEPRERVWHKARNNISL